MDRDLMKDLGLMATKAQLDYIDQLLDHSDGILSLSDYTTTPLEDLTKEEASDIIDEMKGALGYD